MDLVTLSIAALLMLCLVLYLNSGDDKLKRMPPGPAGLPLFGNIFTLVPRDYLAYTRFKRQYGKLCTVRLGPYPLVVLNSYEAIQEAFLGQADIFSGRPKTDFFSRVTRDSGMLFTDGPLWQEHRRFTLRMMRDFGLGRALGETIVREECESLREQLEASLGTPINTREAFTSTINNVIARLIFGERCGSEDPNFKKFTRYLDDSLNFRIVDLLPMIFPWILKVRVLDAAVEYFSQMKTKMEYMHDYIREKIDRQAAALRSMDPPPADLDQATNICEAFLIEQAKQEAGRPGGHTFTEWQLVRNMFELFLAGTETTSTTLTWTTLLLAVHPDIQRRVQREIEEQIGRDRPPSMADRQQLPYVCAVMDEVLRYSSLVASNVGHRTLRDTELMGYHIPADTIIQSNLYGVHHDPQLWARPEEFHPEHFLSPDGDYRPSKFLIPFSLGKRACLGESLARMEYFLGLVTLMQRLEVRLADSKKSVDAILFGEVGGVRRPLDHSIVFSRIEA